ncbi:2OG-Fe(II) oxygenase family protein [Falsiroseomonas oryzae]|uniref:2OG-Fe(II) oxygenase family protein n=1 Tax=Falsiroseomonas oryzae TaxID=2766473 RepID=UPI0022EB2F83|nr:2OG-Fe(II) oxygenase [Roseomonas sp. MO-31]
MSTPNAFRPGDILPPLVLPDATGQPYDLMQQGIAGQHRVLVLGRPPAASLMAAAEARGAVVLLVAPQKPDGARRNEGPQRLFDPERKVFAGLGLPEGGVAVISPRGRLAFARAGDGAMDAAIAMLPEEPDDPPVRRGGAPVLLIPEVLEPEFIAALLAHWEASEKTQDRVASAAAGADAAPSIKRRSDVFLSDRALYEGFHRRMERRVLPEMWRAYRFRAASFEAPRIGCYDSANAGAFGAHRDNRTPYTAHRRFAMSLNLNTGAYEGGMLRFAEFGPELYEPGAGGAAIFCCDLLHEALPVTRGRRFAIFTFFTDAEGAQQERKLMADAAARGQQGVQLR